MFVLRVTNYGILRSFREDAQPRFPRKIQLGVGQVAAERRIDKNVIDGVVRYSGMRQRAGRDACWRAILGNCLVESFDFSGQNVGRTRLANGRSDIECSAKGAVHLRVRILQKSVTTSKTYEYAL